MVVNDAGWFCAICGRQQVTESGFLLVENAWADRLTILRWDDRLASQLGIRCACGAMHVEQLVVHWMTTGSLQYPLARSGAAEKHTAYNFAPRYGPCACDRETFKRAQVGEIEIDRAALNRVIRENPLSLLSILEALVRALNQSELGAADSLQAEEQVELANVV